MNAWQFIGWWFLAGIVLTPAALIAWALYRKRNSSKRQTEPQKPSVEVEIKDEDLRKQIAARYGFRTMLLNDGAKLVKGFCWNPQMRGDNECKSKDCANCPHWEKTGECMHSLFMFEDTRKGENG